MAYIGRGIDNISNASLLDAITFTDSAGPYNLTQGSGATAFTPISVQALVMQVDGVIQDPGSYTISSATITFDSVMAASSTNDFIVHNGVGLIVDPSDGSVSTAKIEDLAVTVGKLATDAVTNPKVANDAIGVAELSATGTASSSTFLRGDNAWSAVTVGELTTINTFFSNWNNIDSNITTTLVTTKNQFLAGPITVADTYTWTLDGTGQLTIL